MWGYRGDGIGFHGNTAVANGIKFVQHTKLFVSPISICHFAPSSSTRNLVGPYPLRCRPHLRSLFLSSQNVERRQIANNRLDSCTGFNKLWRRDGDRNWDTECAVTGMEAICMGMDGDAQTRGRKSATTDWAHHVESWSGLITIVVMTFYTYIMITRYYKRTSDN